MRFYKIQFEGKKVNPSEPPGYCEAVTSESDGLFYASEFLEHLLDGRCLLYTFVLEGTAQFPCNDIVGYSYDSNEEIVVNEEVIKWIEAHGYKLGETGIPHIMPSYLVRSFKPGWHSTRLQTGVPGESIINVPVKMHKMSIDEIKELMKDEMRKLR